MERIDINSKGNVEFAGFWLRFAAFLIDSLVIGTISLLFAIPLLLALVSAAELADISTPEELMELENLMRISFALGGLVLFSLFNLVFKWLYYAIFESSKYQGTLGKIAIGIQVTDYDGKRISFGKASGRYFARIITNMTMLIGYIIAGFTDKKQALHDMIASCIIAKR